MEGQVEERVFARSKHEEDFFYGQLEAGAWNRRKREKEKGREKEIYA